MKSWMLTVALGTFLSGCASGFHAGPTRLTANEQTIMSAVPKKECSPFRRVWRSQASWGYLKWDEDNSSTVASAPTGVLQAIRDEVGRLNQRAPTGKDARLAVTIYGYRREGLLSSAEVSYEAAARDENGALLWAVDDVIEPSAERAESLADDEATLVARELAKKVRAEFGR